MHPWKSFWIGTIAAVVIAIIAGVALSVTGMPSAQKFTTANVRL
jgi:hypothetical protein